jgi:hypothetical protein
MYLDPKTGQVQEIQQYLFDLMEQNEAAMDEARSKLHGSTVNTGIDGADAGAGAKVVGVDDRDSAGRVWEQALKDAGARETGDDGKTNTTAADAADADADVGANTVELKEDDKSKDIKDGADSKDTEKTEIDAVTSNSTSTSDSASTPTKPKQYLGTWVQHGRELYSWRALSGSTIMDAPTMEQFLATLPYSSRRFVALQVWKQAGFAGQETPENVRCAALHDRQEAMMRCLFPEQDERCFANSWLK